MTLADNDNAALRSQVQHLHGVISLLRADNGHLRGRLAIQSERRWSRDPAEMGCAGCGCGEGPDGVHARWGPVMGERSTSGAETVVQGIDLGEQVGVAKGTAAVRDSYGGVVRVSCHWKDGGCSGMAAVELDRDGVEQLVSALWRVLAQSERDYMEAGRR